MISFRIKELLDLRGMDELQLSAALDRDMDYIRRLLMGIEPVTMDDLVEIASWLDVPAWALVADTDYIPGDKKQLTAYVECDGKFFRATDKASLQAIIDSLD